YRNFFYFRCSLMRFCTVFLPLWLLLYQLPVEAQEVEDIQELEEEAAEIEMEDVERPGATEINVKNADIAAVIRIFSKKTKRNYILDERIKGKVSIYLPGKISSDEAIRILDSVLQLKGFTAVPIGDNLLKIIPAREARQTTIPTITS